MGDLGLWVEVVVPPPSRSVQTDGEVRDRGSLVTHYPFSDGRGSGGGTLGRRDSSYPSVMTRGVGLRGGIGFFGKLSKRTVSNFEVK